MNRHRMLFLLLLAMVLSLGASVSAEGEYYYFKGGLIPIVIDTNSVFIQFQGLSPDQAAPLVTEKYPHLTYDPSNQQCIEAFGLFDLHDSADYQATIAALEEEPFVSVVSPVTLSYDTQSFIAATLICNFHPTVSQTEIDSLVEYYNLIVEKDNVCELGAYLFRVTENSPSVIDMANILYEQGYASFSHPNFYSLVTPDSYTIQDEYYLWNQWNIQKVVGLPGYPNAAWEISTGDPGVFISVIDQGIEPHEDFDSTKFSWGFDFLLGYAARFPVPQGLCEAHGMACAGLICAQHNNPLPFVSPDNEFSSSAGIAPNCGMIAERILSVGYTVVSDAMIAATFYFARLEAGVVNCSWTYWHDPVDIIDTAIDVTAREGRGGLGSVIVFSSGNHTSGFPFDIRWPKTKECVLAIGAIDDGDSLYRYSNFGPELDLVAPSGVGFAKDDYDEGIWTTDRMDTLGIVPVTNRCIDNYSGPDCNDIDYNCGFGGTSAAAPLVTGTAALIMSRRQDLTAEEIIDVLKNSAVKDLDWGTITPELEDMYGSGRVNAFRALLAVWRGDTNNDGNRDVADAVYLINYLFKKGPSPVLHVGAGDVNNDANVNVGDAVYLINYSFKDGPAPMICYTYDYES